jgi:hypothetical protein
MSGMRHRDTNIFWNIVYTSKDLIAALPMEVEEPRHDIDHSPPSTAKVKHE